MKIKNFIICFLFINMFCVNSFCMKKNIKKNEIVKIKRGKEVFTSFVGYVKSCDKEKREKIINITAANITYFSLDKAVNSTKEISAEIKDVPYLGKILSLPGISWLTDSLGCYIISKIIDFKEVNKNRDEIKKDIKEALDEGVLSFNTVLKEYKGRLWFKNKITNFTSKKEEHKKMYTDMLCLSVYLAQDNEEVFKKFIKQFVKIKIATKSYPDYFFKKLCEDNEDLEKKIKASCYRD